jgi:polyphosphate kinase 2 (PPK2 family)
MLKYFLNVPKEQRRKRFLARIVEPSSDQLLSKPFPQERLAY